MRFRTLLASGFALWGLTSVLPDTARSHEFWLAPSSYRAGPSDTLSVQAFVGTGFRGDQKAYSTTRTVRFTVQGARRMDLAPAVGEGESRWAMLILADGGGHLFAFESNSAFIELPANRFDAYLAAEGLDAAIAARGRLGLKAGPGRERYARCCKTWIAGRDESRITRTQGLTLEIVPLANPEKLSQLPIKVLYKGKPLSNVLIRTWNRNLAHPGIPQSAATRDSVGPVQQLRTSAEGTAMLRVDHSGEWLVSVVHMLPSQEDPDADWQSYWSSFTFAR